VLGGGWGTIGWWCRCRRPGQLQPGAITGQLRGLSGTQRADVRTAVRHGPASVLESPARRGRVSTDRRIYGPCRAEMGRLAGRLFRRAKALWLHQGGTWNHGRMRPIPDSGFGVGNVCALRGNPNPSTAGEDKTRSTIGEAGLGHGLKLRLALHCDCLGEIRYLDVVLNDDDGLPVTPDQTPSWPARGGTTGVVGSHRTANLGTAGQNPAPSGGLVGSLGPPANKLRVRLLLVFTSTGTIEFEGPS